ncbi:2,3-diaminopropionate biosynthesis protein SbnA [Streptomyces sp. NPDC090127]|uniref:2,3-diaminopropionate biosynthesis protein SbnA n=1 Tax=Streptomyces sp. NPDC090127 TaxID=3365953 RepID=UPI0037F8897C
MPVITAPHAYNEDDLYVDLMPTLGQPLFLKCEGFNFAGSIKLKAATEMVESAERRGILTPDSILVESSSGNLGVALSIIAASKGYEFVCVTDSRCNLTTRLMMEALGAHVHLVSDVSEGSLLAGRLAAVRGLCASDPRCVWLSQYSNPDNWKAHYFRTAPAIAQAFPQIDVLFVGVGTTGTLMGCARYFHTWSRPVRIVAVDTVGSAIFGDPPGRRMIPGLGMSMRPPLLDRAYVDDVVRVAESDTIRTCRAMAARGFVFGGSTGTVVSGATGWLDAHRGDGLTCVAISPDLGERYLDTIYQSNWVQDLYGAEALHSDARVPEPARSAVRRRPPR